MKHVFSVIFVSSVFSVLAFSPCVRAQSKWTLTTADFRSAQVSLSSLDQSGASVMPDGAPAPRVVKWDEVLLLEREPSSTAKPPPTTAGASAAAGKFILYVTGGDQFRGEPKSIENETLVWNSPAVGAVTVPLKQVVAIGKSNQPSPASDAKRTEDVVTLANGDSVRGILSALAGGTLKVQSQGGEVPVPLENVASVLLATTGGGGGETPTASARAFRVRLADDSMVTGSALVTSAGGKLTLTLAAGKRDVPLASVTSIEQINGPVSWLSSRRPVENVQTPLLDTARPARMDRTVAGRPIRFADRTYARGIGITPYSRITWDLPAAGGNYKAFRTQYAIDGLAPYADVTVRVKLDGKTVHERTGFTAGELSPVVLVPLNNAKQLTLEVDFGGNYNVQDRLNWIEPALITATAIPSSPVPAPAPARSPATTQSSQPAPAAQ
jgi:NPCBM/NEW2 domain